MELANILRLQLMWGADEFLLPTPQDRRKPQTALNQAALNQSTPHQAAPSQQPQPAEGNATTTPTPAPKKPRTQPGGIIPTGPAEAQNRAQACNTLHDLRTALENFTLCPLRDTATQLVFADGPETARLMLIGEAPGAEEDRDGRPFIGPAGQLLNKMLASIGLNRADVRIVNTVPWRPPGNRAPADHEIATCLPFLHRHIALIQPDCLVLLGAVAAKALLPPAAASAGIGRLRGKWQSLTIPGLAAPLPCLPTYHPAYLLRLPAAKRDSWHDLLALRLWLAENKTAG